ncbi:MAG TPA: polymer-forming cytoskeletal protein, partial [Candidatus Saccharimonadales bacterium]|nr:polymer-forming cytoskeletal protein [Candidatus Saccharimonadales bacterium]
VTGDAQVDGGLGVSGNVAIGGGLDVQGAISGNSLDISGMVTAGSLSVSGSASVGTLSVSGDASVGGNLTVGGHVLTGGQAPAVQVESGAGHDATCTLTGNDTGGSITIATGDTDLADGTECTVTFHTTFGNAPNPVVSPRNKDSAGVGVYVGADSSKMTIQFSNAPAAHKTYTFNYFNAQ